MSNYTLINTQHTACFTVNLKKISAMGVHGNDSVIKQMIIHIHKLIGDGLNKCDGATNCQYLEMFVDMNVKVEYVWDVKLQELLSSSTSSTSTSKTSIMNLPERMEIDDDQCLKDIDCVICLQQLEGEKIVCMPCSHMFHTHYIKTWLDKSHSYPICRYNMPTS
ncbi:hypothetical protein R3W88_028488 [Solanum pinnatisectum]|uniref:RING-type E3 ubiquitin transferase n=1 Tax=Solanum pinnatisectum TaxID=50273 RepID=A0AAV9K3Q5_9SOLN|nr:hypothetical protein R3W88_028488 [Solanum pinnatisectum]